VARCIYIKERKEGKKRREKERSEIAVATVPSEKEKRGQNFIHISLFGALFANYISALH
jgi:hypothetical protein